MARFLFLDNTPNGRPEFLDCLDRHRIDVVQQYELDRLDLRPFTGVILAMHSDQIHLRENAEKLDACLDDGGAVIFNGHVGVPQRLNASGTRRRLPFGAVEQAAEKIVQFVKDRRLRRRAGRNAAGPVRTQWKIGST